MKIHTVRDLKNYLESLSDEELEMKVKIVEEGNIEPLIVDGTYSNVAVKTVYEDEIGENTLYSPSTLDPRYNSAIANSEETLLFNYADFNREF